jgi:hypothetical protein
MGVPTSEVGYTSATTGRGDHEVHKGHTVALGEKNLIIKPNGRKRIVEHKTGNVIGRTNMKILKLKDKNLRRI